MSATTTSVRPARRAVLRRYLPPQHGAWAMLLVPWLAGVLTAGFHPVHVPLLAAWLTGYLAGYYTLQAAKTGRMGRTRGPLLAYGPPAALCAAVVVAARPQTLWFAPAYAALLAVNAAFARRRRERALLNDAASVLQAGLMVPVVAVVAGRPPGTVAFATLATLAYFAGTVLYVKTMIRERGHAGYRRASVAYHAVVAAAFLPAGAAPAAFFGLALLRAWLLPRYALRPARVGMLEIALSALLVAVIAGR